MRAGRILPIALLAAFLALSWFTRDEEGYLEGRAGPEPTLAAGNSGDPVRQAFEQKQGDLQMLGAGSVVRVLADDTQGSRHQRFILRTPDGITVLVAHNIDLAPRIPALEAGDRVTFFGEYEWNEQGGVIHWTHHDPKGRHVGGWLEHDGQRYE